MKQAPLIISIIALVAASVFGILSLTDGKKASEQGTDEQTESVQGNIVYVDLDRILQEYDMANDLRSVFETKVQSINADVNRRQKKLENDAKSFNEKVNKGLMTRSTAEVQAQKLQQQEQDFNNYAQTKQQEIMEEQTVMNNQLADAIKTFIDKYNEKMQYALILTNQAGVPVISGDSSLDITDDVLAGLNEEYVKNKNTKSEE